MKNDSPIISEEMKHFLQEGLANYAPALIALTEFRSRISVRLQDVLNEFAEQLAELCIPVEELKPWAPKLDENDLKENTALIGIQKSYGPYRWIGYYVYWNLDKPAGEQVWVGARIWPGKTRQERDRFFTALQRNHSKESKTDLDKLGGGTSDISVYCNEDEFYNFDTTFRSMIQEWIEILPYGFQALVAEKTNDPDDGDE